jgi:hypothetical protein
MKGLQDSAWGFNPRNQPPRRRALKGRHRTRFIPPISLLKPARPSSSSAPGSTPRCPGNCARQCIGGRLSADCAANHRRQGQAIAAAGGSVERPRPNFGRAPACRRSSQARSLENMCCGGVPLAVLRSFQTRYPPLVCCDALWQSRKNPRLSKPATAKDHIRGRLRFVESFKPQP